MDDVRQGGRGLQGHTPQGPVEPHASSIKPMPFRCAAEHRRAAIFGRLSKDSVSAAMNDLLQLGCLVSLAALPLCVLCFGMPMVRMEGKHTPGRNRFAADQAGMLKGLRSEGVESRWPKAFIGHTRVDPSRAQPGDQAHARWSRVVWQAGGRERIAPVGLRGSTSHEKHASFTRP